jgi:hypothetical protein
MNERNNETERRRSAAAIGIWENEGGAPGRDSIDHLFGRRIESDRSWTVYHVFTGIPARADEQAMIGLTRSDATEDMLFLNRRNARLQKERTRLSAPVLTMTCNTAVNLP